MNINTMVSTTNNIIEYRRTKLKLKQQLQHILFLRTCLEEELKPKFARHKFPKHLKTDLIQKIMTKDIKTEIKKHYSIINDINIQLYYTYQELTITLHFEEIEEIMVNIEQTQKEKLFREWEKKDKKLKQLREEQRMEKNRNTTSTRENLTTHKFHKRVTNMSKTPFNQNEMNLLEKGLKYSIYKTTNLRKTALELEAATRGLPKEEEIHKTLQQILMKEETKITKRKKKNNEKTEKKRKNEEKTLKTIKEKIEKNDLIFTKGDKSAGLVILDKINYIEKTEKFLNDNNFIKTLKNPTNSFHEKVKKIINNSKTTLTKYGRNVRSIIPMNPKIPRLYALPKLHKQNMPIRPIITSIDSSTYKISKFLIDIFKTNINFQPTHTIRNRSEIITELSTMSLPKDFTILSFDIVNLYTNIPTRQTLNIIKDILSHNITDLNDRNNIFNLFEISLQQNFCKFNNNIYSYEEGLPMGSPLSSLISDIFLNEMETKLIINKDNNPYFENIKFWKRYVDDILVIVNTKDNNTINKIHKYINSIHSKIQFTIEQEKNNEINYLDINIKRTQDNGFIFNTYRKPTQTDAVIPYDSYHCNAHKLAAFRSHIHRAYNSKMNTENLTTEINTIYQVAKNNNFPTYIINNIINKQQKKQKMINCTTLKNQHNEDQSIYYRAITFQGNISNKIKQSLKQYNINLNFKPNKTLERMLINNKDKINKLDDNGVYILECDTCKAAYIGETGRSLRKRIREHKHKNNSNFGNHLTFNSKHEFNEDKNSRILHHINKSYYLEIMENYEINKFLNNCPDVTCLNEQIIPTRRPLYTYLKQPYTPPRKPPEL
nr:uncharacterized protein LOC111421016 [Onthophagus taurus]